MIILMSIIIFAYVFFGIINAMVISIGIAEDTFKYTAFDKWFCLIIAFALWPVFVIKAIVENQKKKHGKL